MKKTALLISLPILIFSFSNFKSVSKESTNTTITCGGAMVTFAGKRNGEIDLGTAQKTTELYARYPKNGKVLSFKMIVTSNDKVMEFKAEGNKLTPEMKTQLGKLKTGKNLVFTDIQVEWREGKVMKAPGISLKLM